MTKHWGSPTESDGATGDPGTVLPAVATTRLLAVVVALLAVLTAGVAFGVPWLVATDQRVADWGYHATYGHPALSTWWIGVARYGQPWVLRLVMVAVAAVLAWRRLWKLAVWLVAVSGTENLVAPSVKYLLSRPRPHWTNPITVEHSLAYPSGHATAAGMFVTAVALLVFVTVRSPILRTVLLTIAVGVWLVVSADRILLGVHYLSDVLAGNLLGSAISLLGWLLLLRWQRRGDASRRP